MRLTEDGAKVLLLEAGPPDIDPNIWSPNGWPAVWNTERYYAYNTVPQSHADRRQIYWPRGRTLGGSSAINGMIYVRGHRSDYDAWAYDGCLGWDYDSVLPYFKKSEDYEGGASDYHGVGGPLRVTKNHNPHPVCKAAVDAAVEAGFPFNDDCNGAEILVRKPRMLVAVALANKMARTIWALLMKHEDYRVPAKATAT